MLAFLYKLWDVASIKRSDYIYAISDYIAKKIKKIYRLDAPVIYPGLDSFYFQQPFSKEKLANILRADYDLSLPKKYFYIVSRLYDYKKIDVAIKVCNKLKKHLIIAGIGPDYKYLHKISDLNYIHFLGYVPNELNRALYSYAEAFLFPGYEDFGYTPVESMATGTPVVFYNKGGVKETVKTPACGKGFQTTDEFIHILKTFDKKNYKKSILVDRAKEFSEERFIKNIQNILDKAIKDFHLNDIIDY